MDGEQTSFQAAAVGFTCVVTVCTDTMVTVLVSWIFSGLWQCGILDSAYLARLLLSALSHTLRCMFTPKVFTTRCVRAATYFACVHSHVCVQVCAPSPLWFGNGTQAFWVLMFVASKVCDVIHTCLMDPCGL